MGHKWSPSLRTECLGAGRRSPAPRGRSLCYVWQASVPQAMPAAFHQAGPAYPVSGATIRWGIVSVVVSAVVLICCALAWVPLTPAELRWFVMGPLSLLWAIAGLVSAIVARRQGDERGYTGLVLALIALVLGVALALWCALRVVLAVALIGLMF
jgi:hypothetical protein